MTVKDVSIRYKMGDFKDIGLKEWTVRHLTHNYHVENFLAVNGVSFELHKGDLLGIIGTNGAGKSTLLKAVAGIMEPTAGKISSSGSISALLELGSGFDGDLTVKENAYLRGAMLGYTREFLDTTYEQIVSFAELEAFEDRPFKQLSSGMQARLAFSIASMVQPEILILDEVLSVGDGAFQEKSSTKMMEIIKGGAATILVSHSLSQIRQMCNKVLWLDNGKQIAFGETQEICDHYELYLRGDITALQSVAEVREVTPASGSIDDAIEAEAVEVSSAFTLAELKQDYDAIISLGQRSLVSYHLERNKLRMYSYPFDWAITPDSDKICETIDTKFSNWLKLKNLHDTGAAEREHTIVLDQSNGFSFPHIFPFGKPLEHSYTKLSLQQQAKARRFMIDLTQNKKILFIRTNCTSEESRRLYVSLSRAASPNEVFLLVVNMSRYRAVKELPSPGKNICSVEIFDENNHWTGYSPHWDVLLQGIGYTSRSILHYLEKHAQETDKETFNVRSLYSFMVNKMGTSEIESTVYRLISRNLLAKGETDAYLEGFAPPESDSHGSFRWMNELEAHALCQVNPWDRELKIIYRNIFTSLSHEALHVSIFAHDELIYQGQLQEETGKLELPLTAELKAKACQGIMHIRLTLDRLWKPDNYLGNGDARELGLVIRSLSCSRSGYKHKH